MKKIHQFENVALLSNKEVKEIKESVVVFEDGSSANLEKLFIHNCGFGEIKFEFVQEYITENSYIGWDDENLQGASLFFELHVTGSDEALIELNGLEKFHFCVDMDQISSGIILKNTTNPEDIAVGEMFIFGKREKENSIDVKIIIKKASSPCSLFIENTGSGKGKVYIPLDVFEARINGPLEIDCNKVSNANIIINSSGNVNIQEILKLCNAQISGPGHVLLQSGNISKLKAYVNGPGIIDAPITVEEAELTINGSGKINVYQILEQLNEVINGPGEINIKKRK